MIVEEIKQKNMLGYNGYGDKYKTCQIEGCTLLNTGNSSLPLCDVHLTIHLRGECLGMWKND